MKRIAEENEFDSVRFYYEAEGLIPKTNILWQQVFPFLRGKNWSDALVAELIK
jgi:hypothetical protein